MAIPIFQRTIVNDTGDVISGAEITVVNEATGLDAVLFSDRAGTVPLTNPFFTAADGLAQFYASAGEYRITASGVSGTVTWRYVTLTGATVLSDALILRSEDDTTGFEIKNFGDPFGSDLELNIDVSSELTDPQDIAQDSFGNYWVVGIGVTNNKVFKYSSSGVYTGINFDVTAQLATPTGITIDIDDSFRIVGSTSDKVFKFDSSGVWTGGGDDFSVSIEMAAPTGIERDSKGNYWLVDVVSKIVFKYDSSGVYTGGDDDFSVSAELSSPTGITIDAFENFLIVGNTTDKVFQYDSSGVYSNKNFSVFGELPTPTGVLVDSIGNILVVGVISDVVVRYSQHPSSVIISRFGSVDIGALQIDSESQRIASRKPLKVAEPIESRDATSMGFVENQGFISANKYARFENRQASGVDGGTATSGSKLVAALNHEAKNNIEGAVLSSNKVTLLKGKYTIDITQTFYQVGYSQCIIYDVTNAAVLTYGSSVRVATGESTTALSIASDTIELNETTEIAIYYEVETTRATAGLGFGGTLDFNIFAKMEIMQYG